VPTDSQFLLVGKMKKVLQDAHRFLTMAKRKLIIYGVSLISPGSFSLSAFLNLVDELGAPGLCHRSFKLESPHFLVLGKVPEILRLSRRRLLFTGLVEVDLAKIVTQAADEY
jgi:hypothetical protein